MKLVKIIFAWILLPFGLGLSVAIMADLANPKAENKEGSVAALFLFALPSTALGSWLAWDAVQGDRREKQDRLQTAFYHILENNEGKITVLRFAKETDLSGTEAKQYLEAKAKEFNANYDVSEQGDITYRFTL